MGTIEWVDDQNGVARFSEALAHLTESRPEPKDVWPNENAWGSAARRMHEVAIGGTVRGGDIHLRFGYDRGVCNSRKHHGHACPQQDAELPSGHEAEPLEFLPIAFKMILGAHSRYFILVFSSNRAAKGFAGESRSVEAADAPLAF